MTPALVIAGRLSRDFILPLAGPPLLDAPGGSLLYAAAGAAVWTRDVGLLGRVGEDYPQVWLQALEQAGLDVRGVRVLPQPLEVRSFYAWLDAETVATDSPTAHFARRQLPFPKALLGYSPRPEEEAGYTIPPLTSPRPSDIPTDYRTAAAAHLCRLDVPSAGRLLSTFQDSGVPLLTLAMPCLAAGSGWEALRPLLYRLTAFLSPERSLRALFAGQMDDLWAMLEAVASCQCALVVIWREGGGQVLYDAASRRRWEVPPYPARLRDPTGVGDAFCGGFLAGLHNTGDALQAVLHGNISASLTLEGSGVFYALEALPGLAQARLEALRALARPV
jgi:sugar/nucleoside kinase (ribokinase family)